MTDKEQQIKNSFIYLVPVVVGNLIPLLTLPVFTRVLTKEDYGVYALAQVYAVFMTGLINFGLTVGYERNFFEYKDEKRTAELLYSTLAFVIVSYALCVLLTYLFKSTLAGCRTVVGQRLKQSGMHWTVRGANSIIALRCSIMSNRWEDFWEHRAAA